MGYAVPMALVALVVWPVFRDPPVDSFPHSDYPMFSRPRPDVVRVTHALGVDAAGVREPLAPGVSSGHFEVLQSQAAIRLALRAGAEAAQGLCHEAAGRVAGSRDLAHLTHVELATSRYDVGTYFTGGHGPVARAVHTRCEVPR